METYCCLYRKHGMEVPEFVFSDRHALEELQTCLLALAHPQKRGRRILCFLGLLPVCPWYRSLVKSPAALPASGKMGETVSKWKNGFFPFS